MARILHIPSFAGGVVKNTAPDGMRTDELSECNGYEIVGRGSLAPSDNLTNYVQINDEAGVPIQWARILSVQLINQTGTPELMVCGVNPNGDALMCRVALDGSATPVPATQHETIAAAGAGLQVTIVPMQYTENGEQLAPVFMCWGARAGARPRTGLSVWYLQYNTVLATWGLFRVDSGEDRMLGDGTSSVPLYFRGIAAYNNHLFGWGYEHTAIAGATLGDAPGRLMFSNLGDPFMWGNDPGGAANRTFDDTDAIIIGKGGERITAAAVWRGRLFVGTDLGLHYVEGLGRLTFEQHPVDGAESVVGPHCLLEGPDGLLYGAGSRGMWCYDGSSFDPLHAKLRDMTGRSIGWNDLIWRDASNPLGAYPGATNEDLCWMVSDPLRRQVWLVIPYVDATNGYGPGNATVVLKYHVDAKAWTRQIFLGVILTAGAIAPRGAAQRQTTYIGRTNTIDQALLQRYAYRATASEILAAPTQLAVTMGPYAPYGPNGIGAIGKVYLTLSFESASTPIELDVVLKVDGQSAAKTARLTIHGGAPVVDAAKYNYWLDTGGTDAVIGVGTAGDITPAHADYRLKEYRNGAWCLVPGAGQKEGRVTLPIAFKPMRGTRCTVSITPSGSSSGRHQIEGLGLSPAIVREGI